MYIQGVSDLQSTACSICSSHCVSLYQLRFHSDNSLFFLFVRFRYISVLNVLPLSLCFISFKTRLASVGANLRLCSNSPIPNLRVYRTPYKRSKLEYQLQSLVGQGDRTSQRQTLLQRLLSGKRHFCGRPNCGELEKWALSQFDGKEVLEDA